MSEMSDYLTGLYEEIPPDHPILSLVQPKRIIAPTGYHPHRCLAGWMASALFRCQSRLASGQLAQTVELSVYSSIYQAVAKGVPTYYVSEDFARAVAATELLEALTVGDLRWPVSGMVLAFPTAFMKEYCGTEICYIVCAQILAGEHRPPIQGCPIIDVPKSKAALCYSCENGVSAQVSAYQFDDRLADFYNGYAYRDETGATDAMRLKHLEDRVNQVTSLVYKLLLILSVAPDKPEAVPLIQPGYCLRAAAQKHGREREALWSPNMIGSTYRLRAESQGGTHASPRMHLRRGHLHQYAHGPGRTLRKWLWTEPMLVGGTVKEAL